MRVNTSLLGWGVFLIALGAVPLAVERGVIATDAVGGWWSLWPVLLIGGGVALVLRATPIGTLAGLVLAAGAGLMLGSAVVTGFAGLPVTACGDERDAVPFAESDGDLAEGGSIDVELNCGDLEVAVGDGAGWRLTGAAEADDAPTVEAGADAVVIRPGDERSGLGFGRARSDWRLTIPSSRASLIVGVNAAEARLALDGATLDRLELRGNASDVRVDVAGVESLAELDVEVNAASLTLSLPDRSLGGRLSANAGSVKLCVPEGAGLRIESDDNPTASNNFGARGLERDGDAWQTPDFGDAETKIDLEADANAASIELDPEEGCGG